MRPATEPRSAFQAQRLLHIQPSRQTFWDSTVRELPELLSAGDLLVVNDAATLPASLPVIDRELEVRLCAHGAVDGLFRALLFGAGDYRIPTEQRPAPVRVRSGERLRFGADLAARVIEVDRDQPRLVDIEFEQSGSAFWRALYRHARPVQYAYLERPLELWDVQNAFAGRPWAFELPSAGRPLTWETLLALRARGVRVASLTHAAGLSSTGSRELDARLPFGERYEISSSLASALREAKQNGRRVIAVGTTVVRALEARALESQGSIEAGAGTATLVLGPGFVPRVVHGLLTGMHEAATSHFAVMRAFAREDLLIRALEHAERAGYLAHEFGDSCLIA
jgi:S-adenosylmethionine:tRNA ribosyltransferase-isomerase